MSVNCLYPVVADALRHLLHSQPMQTTLT